MSYQNKKWQVVDLKGRTNFIEGISEYAVVSFYYKNNDCFIEDMYCSTNDYSKAKSIAIILQGYSDDQSDESLYSIDVPEEYISFPRQSYTKEYVCSDGKNFDNLSLAQKHENSIIIEDLTKNINNILFNKIGTKTELSTDDLKVLLSLLKRAEDKEII